MSKLYLIYKKLKEINKTTIYLFKSGIFYIALSDDAIFLASKFNLKLTNLNSTILKCGFPVSSIDKYITKFNLNNINFEIVDAEKNALYLPRDFTLNKKIENLLDLISSIDINSLSVSKAYEFIETIQKQTEEIKKLINKN